MRSKCAGLVAALICLGAGAAEAAPLGTSFTYQGQLQDSGVPLDGSADVLFRLFDAAIGGTQIGSAQQASGILVEKGLFTANVDFGASSLNGDARWLELSVRSPAGGGPFTTLAPRQPVTGTPYALQTRGLHVTAANDVGIGTAAPAKKLTVAGDMEIGTHSGDYRHMRIGGGNCSGFLYGSYPALGDGIHMGYNYYADAGGAHRIVATDGRTSRLSLGYGYAAIATGGINQVPVNRLTISSTGEVGLGTDSPAVKLDVRGNLKFGPAGQYFASGGDEGLRMMRGIIDAAGTVLQGVGFTAARTGIGTYRITFNIGFTGLPSSTATAMWTSSPRSCSIGNGSTQNVVYVTTRDNAGNYVDCGFHFTVIGPRF
jgi:hypothetical protein